MINIDNDCVLQGRRSHIKIHEDASGEIYTVGVTTRSVSSLQEVSRNLDNLNSSSLELFLGPLLEF